VSDASNFDLICRLSGAEMPAAVAAR
jgi:hypothetical protein